MTTPPRRNIEIKARCTNLDALRAVMRNLCGGAPDVEIQCDTYLPAAHGRLKLREIEGRPAVLIGYARPDQAAARTSAYRLVPVSNPEGLKAVLSAALGVRGTVRKRREIYLWHNVRIHLDEVDGLGSFIEFEAVLSATDGEEVSRRRLEELATLLKLDAALFLAPSYADLLGC